MEDERYSVEITDNGIGIEAANKINEENNMKHSFAMSALKRESILSILWRTLKLN